MEDANVRLGYVTYFLSLIGVTDYFTVSVILYIVMLLSSLSAFILIEFVGRRTLLVLTPNPLLILCAANWIPKGLWRIRFDFCTLTYGDYGLYKYYWRHVVQCRLHFPLVSFHLRKLLAITTLTLSFKVANIRGYYRCYRICRCF